MDFKAHFENAWHLSIKHIAPLILITLVMMGVSVLTIGLLAPVMLAGYVYSLLLLVREGREPKIADLFGHLHLFLPLFLFSFVVFLFILIGFFKLFFLPGIAVACLVTFACLYVLPLMTDKKLGLMEAIKTSWKMSVQGNIADHIVVVILFIGLLSIGSSVFIGTLFTQPFATIFVLSVYMERMGQNNPTAATPNSPPTSYL